MDVLQAWDAAAAAPAAAAAAQDAVAASPCSSANGVDTALQTPSPAQRPPNEAPSFVEQLRRLDALQDRRRAKLLQACAREIQSAHDTRWALAPGAAADTLRAAERTRDALDAILALKAEVLLKLQRPADCGAVLVDRAHHDDFRRLLESLASPAQADATRQLVADADAACAAMADAAALERTRAALVGRELALKSEL